LDAAQNQDNDVECAHADTGSLLVDADVDDVDDTNPSIDLCIELGSGDMIDIDEDTNIFLSIDIDPFLVIDSYADHNS
jgi:hypothetical protein